MPQRLNSIVQANEQPFDICDRTFNFALRIIDVCTTLDRRPGVTWALSKQLLRSGTSIGANLEEAQAGQSRPDFLSKCSIARKEVRETHYWLKLLHAKQFIDSDTAQSLMQECEELNRILTTIIKKTSAR
jgi:four helix bundle protein